MLTDNNSMHLNCGLWVKTLPSQISICDGKEGSWQTLAVFWLWYGIFFGPYSQREQEELPSSYQWQTEPGVLRKSEQAGVFVTLQPASLGSTLSGYSFVLLAPTMTVLPLKYLPASGQKSSSSLWSFYVFGFHLILASPASASEKVTLEPQCDPTWQAPDEPVAGS